MSRGRYHPRPGTMSIKSTVGEVLPPYREKGPKDFYAPRMTRGPAVLVEDVVSEIEERNAGCRFGGGRQDGGTEAQHHPEGDTRGRIRAPVRTI
jgi:hypothetical protein